MKTNGPFDGSNDGTNSDKSSGFSAMSRMSRQTPRPLLFNR